MAGRFDSVQVLVVDDEKQILRLVIDVLRRLGFRQITSAHSGRRAIELISTQPFDFIITDWRMDDLEGIDIIHYVRTSPNSPCPHIPIIMLTGNTESHYVLKARDAGVNEYMIKPFSAEQLVRRIKSIIEKPKSYIEARTYRGPDRRWHDMPPPDGIERRKKPKRK